MKENKLPSIVSILILTLVTAITWIGFSVYRAFVVQPAPSVAKEVIQPLTPTLDTSIIEKIQSSLYLDSSQIPDNVVTSVQTPQPVVVSTPIPTPTPTP